MNQNVTERLDLEPCHVEMLRVAYTPTAGVQVQYEEKGALITGEAKAVEAELSKMRLFIRDIRTERLEGKSASFCGFLSKSSVGKKIRDCFDQERLVASLPLRKNHMKSACGFCVLFQFQMFISHVNVMLRDRSPHEPHM